MKKPRGFKDSAYVIVSYLFPIILAIIILIPFLNVSAKSFSSSSAIVSGSVFFHPIGFDLSNYSYILDTGLFGKAFTNSVFVVVVGTLLSVMTTAMVAYPLSKKDLKGRKFFNYLYLFTMVFTAGMIPDYLLVRKLGLSDSLWSLILPGMIWTYNMLILKSYFEALPQEVEESVFVDGGGYFCCFFNFVLPLSKASLASVALFYGVSYWTDYTKAMLYITSQDKKPLQLFLYEIIAQGAVSGDMSSSFTLVSAEGVKCATIVLSIVPMLLVYPFIQRFFTAGMLLGAVKE